jgi:hypothetical protein
MDDKFAMIDSADSNALKTTFMGVIKSAIKSYLVGLVCR